ncbi:MAG: hypothetical protein J6U64_05400, partial [Alphaproteobacteria bacterium]|nr:hypothetical protein [Alphaproteobacteria bacterium]
CDGACCKEGHTCNNGVCEGCPTGSTRFYLKQETAEKISTSLWDSAVNLACSGVYEQYTGTMQTQTMECCKAPKEIKEKTKEQRSLNTTVLGVEIACVTLTTTTYACECPEGQEECGEECCEVCNEAKTGCCTNTVCGEGENKKCCAAGEKCSPAEECCPHVCGVSCCDEDGCDSTGNACAGCKKGETKCGEGDNKWCCPSDNTCGNASTKQCCKDNLCCENGLKVLAAPLGTKDEYGTYDYNGLWCINCDGHLGCGTDVTVDMGGGVQFCGLNERVLPDDASSGAGVCCANYYNYGDSGGCHCTESGIMDQFYDAQCNFDPESEALRELCHYEPDNPLCK